ncbi:hypothetical protein PV08_05677 [Exophiala spinifera]|uniref:Xylanolytic transcriptional activator regulatory domain-containing protein n=1 Tax=Exophiala spinifera TaxID=91928 RepID=A0A0D2BWI2_9EURO|nr:uncharacterized protein PV08_05677 [Exophiala spinifera]KIW15629.1 hypothetical protein PV08_05677 [Exophiala spinifera]
MGSSTDTATEDGVPTYSRTTETETTTATSLQSLKPSSHIQDEEAEKIQTEEVTIYKGEDLLTRFYGHTYHRNFYQQFDELRPYIQRLKAQCPSINRLRDEIQSLKVNAHGLKFQLDSASVVSDLHIKSLIPAREVADELISMYITRFEATHRVIHIPTFIETYKRYWNNPQTVQTASVAQFLLAMATALSCRELLRWDLKIGDKSMATRQAATTWIQACESWISSNTTRPLFRRLSMMATNCLLVIAKRANNIQRNENWTATGALLRSAMAAGYHREPDGRANITVFYREMRRRIWATVVELDLQAAIERGMPPSIREDDFDSRAPLNINDDAIYESATEAPVALPLQSLTDTSSQAVAYRSLGLRLRICALINNYPHKAVGSQFDEVFSLDKEVMKALREIPLTWIVGSVTEEWQTQRPLYVRSMLDILLRHQLVLLHMRFANQSEHFPESCHSRRARLEAATSILSQFKTLVDNGILPRSGCDTYQFQAAMTVCHELYLRHEDSASVATVYPGSGLAECYISMAEDVLSMMESRITILAKGLNEYYLLTMVLGLVKTRLWTDRSSFFNSEAVERITRIMIILGSIRKPTRSNGPNPAGSVLASDQISGGEVEGTITSLPESFLNDEMEMLGSVCTQDFDLFVDEYDLQAFDPWAADEGTPIVRSRDFDYTTAV